MECLSICRLALHILHYGRNPNRVEPHVLDVVELVDDALPRSAAVLAVTGVTGWAGTVGGCKTVCDKLVNGASTPLVGGSGEDGRGGEKDGGEEG